MSQPSRIGRVLERLAGIPIERDLAPFQKGLAAIQVLRPSLASLSDSALAERAQSIQTLAKAGGEVDTAFAFALVREAAQRLLGLSLFDEQLLAGLALHAGRVVEMATGEGKTLAAVAPAFARALCGRGTHVLTFNDYLARRDAAWMGPIYELLGLSVGVIQDGMSPGERRRAYARDVTYATAKEAGFDHLRGFLAHDPAGLVHRSLHYAIVDEADSILIDEARVPLVIAGAMESDAGPVRNTAALVAGLAAHEHFEVDEHQRNVNLNEAGLDLLERQIGCGDLLLHENLNLLTEISCALHARVLLKRDVDYIVRDGRIELVDELTGRVVQDRHLPDGLQMALEAKEGLERGKNGAILGSLTLQHYLLGYPLLAGMTATACPAAEELHENYGLTVTVIPPHVPSVRIDHEDLVFSHREAKEQALLEEILTTHRALRPILVGTASVEESEALAARLEALGVRCAVLNARRDEQEARIVSEAGAPGAVTISTNMAGRGTDIRLGGADQRDRTKVTSLGGLYVIGTNRHESRRVDDQLRGRAGRQGDKGATRFFVSLEDPLLVRFGVLKSIPKRFRPGRQEGPIDNPLLHSEIAHIQRVVEGQNLEIRRTLIHYAELVERQRLELQGRRQQVLLGERETLFEEAAPEHRAALVVAHGEESVVLVERSVTLFHLDRVWREHLAFVAELREGIHLVRVAGNDPLTAFQVQTAQAFRDRRDEVDHRIVETLSALSVEGGGLDLKDTGLRGPAATWTYIVNDNPFRDQLHMRLAGNVGLGIGLIINFPIFLAFLAWRRLKRRDRG